MKFIPNSVIKKNILNELKLKDINILFSDIPKKIRINHLNISDGLSQQDTEERLRRIGKNNKSTNKFSIFLGGGIKPHYIPAIVKSIISRSEFYTSYTPYQPEASQGFLQAMFEYQSLIAELTGMDVANASLYDGATSLGEAALMCTRINKKRTFVIPSNISWDKRSILRNYTNGAGIKIKEIAYNTETGECDIDSLIKNVDDETTGVYIENPNFFGIFEEKIKEIKEVVKNNQSIFVVGIDPLSLGIMKSPGEYGADIVVGEGRCLGNPMDFGGSSLGIFACKTEFLRQIPGRIIGMTRDKDGNRGFCMTLQTREQHIRRGKATSNICTNEGLCALAATTYLSWLGSKGLEELGRINYYKGQELANKITSIDGFKRVFAGIHFNEFVIECPDVYKTHKKLLTKNIHGGLILNGNYPELKNCMLIGVTEIHSDESIEKLITTLGEI